MRKLNLTPDRVKSFWRYLTESNHCSVIQLDHKKVSFVMKRFISRLEKLGIYANFNAIVFANTIYTKFRIGNGSDKSLAGQVRIGFHEVKHILQGQRVGQWKQSWRYMFNARSRAMWESEGIAAEYQLNHYLTGSRDISSYVTKLRDHYQVHGDDLREAEKYFGRIGQNLKGGAYDDSVNRLIAWLNTHDGIVEI